MPAGDQALTLIDVRPKTWFDKTGERVHLDNYLQVIFWSLEVYVEKRVVKINTQTYIPDSLF